MKRTDASQRRTSVTLVGFCLVMGLILWTNSGCSVSMAAKQPGKKDLSVLEEGTPRSHVIAELGAPVWSGEKDGNKADVFAFTQRYSGTRMKVEVTYDETEQVRSVEFIEVDPTEGY